MTLKREIENWDHYYKLASERKGLKVFKDLLEVNKNMPHIDLSDYKITVEERVKKDEQTELHLVTKTFGELVRELKPKENGSGV